MRTVPSSLSSVLLAAIALIPLSTPAQSGSASHIAGQWSGNMVTDVFRGAMVLQIDRAATGWTMNLSVTVRDRAAAGPAMVTKVSGDSISFTSTVGGAQTTYEGVLAGDSLSGTLEARQGAEVLGRGRWTLRRSVERGAAAAATAGAPSNVAIFDEAWSLVDQQYGNFESKGIDWNLIRRMYRDQAATARDDRDLASTLTAMLSHLNDNHISLRVEDSLYRPNGEIDRSSFVADSVVGRRFVGEARKAGRGQWTYAWLKDSIGYLRIDGFQDAGATRREIDSVLTEFRPARGLVIDLRKHFGGDDRAANAVINRFATSRLLYLTSRMRSGPRHGDFLPAREFYAEPQGAWQFRRPVMILTSRRTVSAGENFLLGMRELPQVTLVGDVTSGAFADVGHVTLANGWQLNFPFNRFLDRNGVSWEGVGLAPDIRVVARPSDIAAGKDVVLDLAVRAVLSSEAKPN